MTGDPYSGSPHDIRRPRPPRLDEKRFRAAGLATSIVLHPPGAAPGITDDERQTILELMAKGSFFAVNLASADVDETFATLEASGSEIIQEPTDQPYGVRDCAVRDPAGNMVRIQQRR